jgi:hypothetical protein
MERSILRKVDGVDLGMKAKQAPHDFESIRGHGEMQGGFTLPVLRVEIYVDARQCCDDRDVPELHSEMNRSQRIDTD